MRWLAQVGIGDSSLLSVAIEETDLGQCRCDQAGIPWPVLDEPESDSMERTGEGDSPDLRVLMKCAQSGVGRRVENLYRHDVSFLYRMKSD